MSAASSAPLRCPEPDDDGRPDSPRGHARARLAVAAPASASAPAGAVSPSAVSPAASPAPVQVLLVPRAEPPARSLPAEGPAHRRPPVLGSPEALGRRRRTTGTTEDDGGDVAVGPLPDPTRLCCAVVQAAVEGLRGVRPLAQLTRWVTPEVYELLALRARLVQEAGAPTGAGRAGIRRVRVFRIGDGAAEATVVVDDGPRVRAVAVRVEEHRGRWRATALEIG